MDAGPVHRCDTSESTKTTAVSVFHMDHRY